MAGSASSTRNGMQFPYVACECVGGLLSWANAATLPFLLFALALTPANAGSTGGQKALLYSGACITAIPCLWYVIRFYLSAIRREFPVCLAVALSHPRLPVLLRAPLMLYWLLLGVSSTVAAATYEWSMARSAKASLEGILIILLMSAGFAYAGRSFLLLAMAALRGRQEHVMAAWRCRHWLTLGIVSCSILLALLV